MDLWKGVSFRNSTLTLNLFRTKKKEMPEMHVYFDLAFMSMENNLQKTHTFLPFYDKTSIEKGKKNQYQTQRNM